MGLWSRLASLMQRLFLILWSEWHNCTFCLVLWRTLQEYRPSWYLVLIVLPWRVPVRKLQIPTQGSKIFFYYWQRYRPCERLTKSRSKDKRHRRANCKMKFAAWKALWRIKILLYYELEQNHSLALKAAISAHEEALVGISWTITCRTLSDQTYAVIEVEGSGC